MNQIWTLPMDEKRDSALFTTWDHATELRSRHPPRRASNAQITKTRTLGTDMRLVSLGMRVVSRSALCAFHDRRNLAARRFS